MAVISDFISRNGRYPQTMDELFGSRSIFPQGQSLIPSGQSLIPRGQSLIPSGHNLVPKGHSFGVTAQPKRDDTEEVKEKEEKKHSPAKEDSFKAGSGVGISVSSAMASKHSRNESKDSMVSNESQVSVEETKKEAALIQTPNQPTSTTLDEMSRNIKTKEFKGNQRSLVIENADGSLEFYDSLQAYESKHGIMKSKGPFRKRKGDVPGVRVPLEGGKVAMIVTRNQLKTIRNKYQK